MAKETEQAEAGHESAGITIVGWGVALLPLGLFVALAAQGGRIAAGQAVVFGWPWLPELGVSFSFYIDGLSLLFGLIITGIGTLVAIYAGGYLAGKSGPGRFFTTLVLFMLAMLGVVTAGNVITLFVFWELTSVTSFVLIGYHYAEKESRDAALQALLVTGGGGLAMLAGLLLVGQAAGSLEIADLLTRSEILRESPVYGAAVVLVLLGAFTKSAQWPFHFWLPGAMAAPTPVSAYLHSATMVKAGVYLLLRMSPVLGETALWTGAIVLVGGVTMVMGAGMALPQRDLKRILAYSTVSMLGLLMVLIGVGGKLAVEGALLLVLAHSLYKGALFLVAGIVDHETGTRDIERLGGLWRKLPLTFVGVTLAGLSMAGVPLLFGFISKEIIYEALWEGGLHPEGLLPGAVVFGVLGAVVVTKIWMVAVALLLVVRGFLGTARDLPHSPHEAPLSMWLGPVLLGGLSLALGVAPGLVDGALIGPAAGAVLGQVTEVKLALWHGFTVVLGLSLGTLVLGVGVYALRGVAGQVGALLAAGGDRIGPRQIYLAGLRGLVATANATARTFSDRSLGVYLAVMALFLLGAMGFTTVYGMGVSDLQLPGVDDLSDLGRVYEWLPPLIIIISAFVVVRQTSRLKAIITLGAIGFAVVMIYVLFGAPDLAMTQLAIETLVVILFVLIVYRLPRLGEIDEGRARWRDGLIATGAGVVVAGLVLVATGAVHPLEVTEYYAANSYKLAEGRNIVNVILVDFRGFDTMGEITVLALAALGVYGLLKLEPKHKEEHDA